MAASTGTSKSGTLSKADYLKRYLSGNGDSKKSKEKKTKKKRILQPGKGSVEPNNATACHVSLQSAIESVSISIRINDFLYFSVKLSKHYKGLIVIVH